MSYLKASRATSPRCLLHRIIPLQDEKQNPAAIFRRLGSRLSRRIFLLLLIMLVTARLTGRIEATTGLVSRSVMTAPSISAHIKPPYLADLFPQYYYTKFKAEKRRTVSFFVSYPIRRSPHKIAESRNRTCITALSLC